MSGRRFASTLLQLCQHRYAPLETTKLLVSHRQVPRNAFANHCLPRRQRGGPLGAALAVYRYFHLSSVRLEPGSESRSKVEDMLKSLREELEAKDKLQKENRKMQLSIDVKKGHPLWQKAVDELKHYYHGFKLLYVDCKVATRLIGRVLRGEVLLRKERRQLVRTTSDIFRLVPFLIFIIVPFMEFALPLFLKFFPNMLPSTFKEESKEREKLNQALKSRLEMAKFLQETLEELSVQRKRLENDSGQLAEFSDFMKKVRHQGYVSNDELLKYSKLFEDQLTLDSLSKDQLRALCLIVGIHPIGTSNMLRFQLRLKLRELKADDRLIAKEGINTLSVAELQMACRARGMRALGIPENRLRSQLSRWLSLSLNEHVPPSLLLLSSTLYLSEDVPFADRLKTIIGTLPTHIADEAMVRLAEVDGARVDNKSKYDLVVSIEEALHKEAEEEARQRDLQTKTVQKEEPAVEPDLTAEVIKQPVDVLIDNATVLVDKAKLVAEPIESAELLEIEKLVETVKGPLADAKDDLEELKEQIEEHQEEVAEVRTIVEHVGEEVHLSKAAVRLQDQVNRLVNRVDTLIGKMEAGAEAPSTLKTEKKTVMVHEVLAALRNLKTVPDEAKRRRVLEVLKTLDDDRDGAIDLQLALKVIDLMVKESVQINPEQLNQALEVLKKECLLDDDEELQHVAVPPSQPLEEAKLAQPVDGEDAGQQQSDRRKVAQ